MNFSEMEKNVLRSIESNKTSMNLWCLFKSTYSLSTYGTKYRTTGLIQTAVEGKFYINRNMEDSLKQDLQVFESMIDKFGELQFLSIKETNLIQIREKTTFYYLDDIYEVDWLNTTQYELLGKVVTKTEKLSFLVKNGFKTQEEVAQEKLEAEKKKLVEEKEAEKANRIKAERWTRRLAIAGIFATLLGGVLSGYLSSRTSKEKQIIRLDVSKDKPIFVHNTNSVNYEIITRIIKLETENEKLREEINRLKEKKEDGNIKPFEK